MQVENSASWDIAESFFELSQSWFE